jgi:biotin transport system substrate-specific component
VSTSRGKLATVDLVYIALMTALIAICAWISIPTTVPFTLQTFGVLCAMGLLGGRRASLAVLLYLLLGAVGLPVFSGFRGGVGVLLGVTGGYLVGFQVAALLYWLLTVLLGSRPWVRMLGMALGLVACYAFGTAWFMVAYAGLPAPWWLATALSWCVLPFLIPRSGQDCAGFYRGEMPFPSASSVFAENRPVLSYRSRPRDP